MKAQYSLRELLAFTLLFGSILGWITYANQKEHQIAELHANESRMHSQLVDVLADLSRHTGKAEVSIDGPMMVDDLAEDVIIGTKPSRDGLAITHGIIVGGIDLKDLLRRVSKLEAEAHPKPNDNVTLGYAAYFTGVLQGASAGRITNIVGLKEDDKP